MNKFEHTNREGRLARQQIELPGESDCTKCPLSETRNLVVLAEGSLEADIMIVGEAPGANEDETGHPMIGQTGNALDVLLFNSGIDRSRVIITNIIQCVPLVKARVGGYVIGKPKKAYIDPCSEWLDYKILNSNVKTIIPVGSFAMKKFLPGMTVGRTHGKTYVIQFGHKELFVMPQFHPVMVYRKPEMRKVIAEDYSRIANVEEWQIDTPPEVNYEIVKTGEDLEKMLGELWECKTFSFDFETTGLDYLTDSIVGVAFAMDNSDTTYYVPTFDDYWRPKDILEMIRPLLESPDVTSVAHNMGFETKMTWCNLSVPAPRLFRDVQLKMQNYRDTMVEFYLLESEFVDLKTLALRVLNVRMTGIDSFIATNKKQLKEGKKYPTMLDASRAELDNVGRYACADADMSLKLAEIGKNWLSNPDLAIPSIGHR